MHNRSPQLLIILGIVALGNVGSGAESPRVRILTYNIHHGAGTDERIDLPRIAKVIKGVNPDLVALQEVDVKTTRSNGVDQAAELGRLTGLHRAFGKAMDYAGGEYGEAILSRLAPTDIHVRPLPFVQGCEPRAALSATISLSDEGPEFLFISTHLEHANLEVRLSQARAITTIPHFRDAQSVILAGDLNDVPDSPPLTALLKQYTDATAGRSDPTWPSHLPTKKIDYVLFRPAVAWRVVEARVLDEPLASDHCPLLVVLESVPNSAKAKQAAGPQDPKDQQQPKPIPPWMSLVPEMERVAEIDALRPGKFWSAKDTARYAQPLKRAAEDWREKASTIQLQLTPQRVKSLSRWAVRQMDQYSSVPAPANIQLKPLGVDNQGRSLILEGTIDTLPTHSHLVTRWLKVLVLCDMQTGDISHVTVTIRGERQE